METHGTNKHFKLDLKNRLNETILIDYWELSTDSKKIIECNDKSNAYIGEEWKPDEKIVIILNDCNYIDVGFEKNMRYRIFITMRYHTLNGDTNEVKGEVLSVLR